jgi:hypothetical protein
MCMSVRARAAFSGDKRSNQAELTFADSEVRLHWIGDDRHVVGADEGFM